MFSCEYCKSFKNSFFDKTPLAAASGNVNFNFGLSQEFVIRNEISSTKPSQFETWLEVEISQVFPLYSGY